MSFKPKEKVAAAIRKFFKGSNDKMDAAAVVVDANGNGNGAVAVAAAATSMAATAPIGAAMPKNGNVPANSNNNNNNNNNNNGPSGQAESPGKRKRQDNKVSPTTSKQNGGPQNPLDLSIRARRLMKEYKEIQKIQNNKQESVFTVDLVNDSLYEWHARLHIVDPDSKLAKDMVEMNIPHILLHLVFPDNFPFAPPFMRVVEPHIEKGFVMEGGAICMELLTPRGWASAYTVEAVLMQFAASLVKGQGRIVRKTKTSKEFTKRTAEEAFRSLVKTHEKYGWVTPALSDG